MHPLLYFISLVALYYAIYILSIIVHEFGHALSYAIFTKEKISIYLGAYGKTKSKKIDVGRFEVWVKKNPFWKGGLCTVKLSDKLPFRQRFISIAAGPFANLLISFIPLAVLIRMRPEGFSVAFWSVFCMISFFFFLVNIFPSNREIMLENGNIILNDGARLVKLLADKKMPESYHQAVALVNEKKYEQAANILQEIIDRKTKVADVYRIAVSVQILLKNYAKAVQLQKEQVEKIGNINMIDRCNMALLKTQQGKYDEAIPYYMHLLKLNGGLNVYNLNNLGYTLSLVGRYEEAIEYTDKAIKMNSKFAYAYSNRAYAKMMCGFWEDGKTDNDESLRLDSDNAYAWRNAGLYYFEKGQYENAWLSFEKTRLIDSTFDSINRHINDVEWYLSQKNNL